jgi:quaternary ammonium compound-resistance protein SugE
MSWAILFFAGVLEVAWAVGLKFVDGLQRPWVAMGTFAALMASVALLGVSLRGIPLGTAYAVWAGVGTVGTAAVGILVFREPATAARLVCVSLIVLGIIGLKFIARP